MTELLSARHRDDAKVLTPLSDLSSTLGTFGKRSTAAASAAGVALTAVVASTASALTPTAVPTAPAADFTANLESTANNTLVSLDVDWDSGDTFTVEAEEPPAPEPEPEPVAQAATRSQDAPQTAQAEYIPAAAPAARLGSVVATAAQFLGTPYVWGGSSPAGFDCSGFTSYVYGMHGIGLSRSSYAQGGAGTAVSLADAQPGDLVIMNGGGHVGIYVGGGTIIHSPRPGKTVEYTSISYFSVQSIRRL